MKKWTAVVSPSIRTFGIWADNNKLTLYSRDRTATAYPQIGESAFQFVQINDFELAKSVEFVDVEFAGCREQDLRPDFIQLLKSRIR